MDIDESNIADLFSNVSHISKLAEVYTRFTGQKLIISPGETSNHVSKTKNTMEHLTICSILDINNLDSSAVLSVDFKIITPEKIIYTHEFNYYTDGFLSLFLKDEIYANNLTKELMTYANRGEFRINSSDVFSKDQLLYQHMDRFLKITVPQANTIYLFKKGIVS